MEEPKKLFVMMIKVAEAVRYDPHLVEWMDEIEKDYMQKYGRYGLSLAHVALDGPWQFALVFPGSKEAAAYLQNEIERRAPGQTQIETMEGVDLDDFKARLSGRRE